MILFEFTICDRQNISEPKLISIAQEELAIEAKQRQWQPGFKLVQRNLPVRQIDGSLIYTFLVVTAKSPLLPGG